MLGFTLDEKAIQAEGYYWLDALLEKNSIQFIELSPELRAAELSLYLAVSKALVMHQKNYQLHLPYFTDPCLYSVNMISQSKQKIVNGLEKWLSLVEKIRYNDSRIPIIIHPATQTFPHTKELDLTAHYCDCFLNLLHSLQLDQYYHIHLENLPLSKGASFANRLESLMAFRNKYYAPTEIDLCLDLCHFESNKDPSAVPYNLIPLYHIHQINQETKEDHKSLQRATHVFDKHYNALKALPEKKINLELLLYAESHYTRQVPIDIVYLQNCLKD